MHRVIQEHLQLLLIGATAAEIDHLQALLSDHPQLELTVCEERQQLPRLLAQLHPDALLLCADQREAAPSDAPPCLWLLRQLSPQPAVDELALASITTARLLHLLALLIDQQRAAERLAQLAQRDALTGLATPEHLHERLERRLAQARRSGKLFALIHLTLDQPSELAALDSISRNELLAQIGAAIAACIDQRQLAVRLGEGEFLLAIVGSQRIEAVAVLARKLLNSCRQRRELQRREWQLTVSAGIAVASVDGDNAEQLLASARSAADQCRQQGGDNFRFASSEQNLLAHELTQLQGELGHALLRNEIALRYQPLFNMHRREVAEIEVLLRWQHPRHGLLAPRYFLDLARSNGAINPLGSWVLRKACEQRRQWQSAGVGPLALTFNVERRQLQQGALLSSVRQLVDEGELEAGALGIEMDEAELANCNGEQMAQLKALCDSGVQFAVDHFSGSHCTVEQLQQLPLRALKLDRRLTDTPGGKAAFERALRLCRALRCDAIAAGVEQRRTAAWLRSSDCDAIQGFVVSRPLTGEELPRWLRRVESMRA